jgi:hypothetical protein
VTAPGSPLLRLLAESGRELARLLDTGGDLLARCRTAEADRKLRQAARLWRAMRQAVDEPHAAGAARARTQ